MNGWVAYYFTLRSTTPLYFGSSEAGQLVKNAGGNPVVLGNAIAGAIRDYLKQTEIDRKMILCFFGGEENRQFVESKLFVSDGLIRLDQGQKERIKEGTRINAQYGAAQNEMKYQLAYLPENTEVTFNIECDIVSESQRLELVKIVSTLAKGFESNHLLIGGQKNNGFGRFEMVHLNKTYVVFHNSGVLDDFIFNRESLKRTTVDWRQVSVYPLMKKPITYILMKGKFPYGVYQNFRVEDTSSVANLTGLQKKRSRYYVPSTSLKGLVKNEIVLLLKRMLGSSERVNRKCEELFGGQRQKGKLTFLDLVLEDEKIVEIERFEVGKNGRGQREYVLKSGPPIYNKIDRLTGGAFEAALKHQQEIQGASTLRVELFAEGNSPYLFPLVHVLRKIGAGIVPLGGRTVIGLGQFFASTLCVSCNDGVNEIETSGVLSASSEKLLRKYYDAFKEWCHDANS